MATVSESMQLTALCKDATRVALSDGSNDLSSDLTFLTSYINTNHPLLALLLSDRTTISSFSELQRKSQGIGWHQTLIEERNSIKADPKSKLKRFMLNRLIHNIAELELQVAQLNERIAVQMTNTLSVEQADYLGLQQLNGVQIEIESWRHLQSIRRLFFENCEDLCNSVVLQRLLTDQYMPLVDLINFGPVNSEIDLVETLAQLARQSFVIVSQPSGTDCVAVTKYEKQGRDFVAKIKTRIICLLDPSQVGEYLELSPIQVTLFLKERETDPEGDVQTPLIWKRRIITDLERNSKVFLYAELNANDCIQLTRRNSKGKPLYNNELCQLEFRIPFKINQSSEIYYSILTSKPFGLCSHAKNYSRFLAKIFLDEVSTLCVEINGETHITTLMDYIRAFHKHLTSVEAKLHTIQFIDQQLQIVYNAFRTSTQTVTRPLTWSIYQDILEKLFTQIRFLGNHPFLSMLYEDSLFHGICDETIDQNLEGIPRAPQMVMRFEIFPKQKIRESCDIIVTIDNGQKAQSCINTHYFIHDMCILFSEAKQNEARQIEISHHDRTIPFFDFDQYYDTALSHDDVTETAGYEPLKLLLERTKRNIRASTSIPSDQQTVLYLTGPGTKNYNTLAMAVDFLSEQLAQWCAMQNMHGGLAISLPSTETMSLNEFRNASLTGT